MFGLSYPDELAIYKDTLLHDDQILGGGNRKEDTFVFEMKHRMALATVLFQVKNSTCTLDKSPDLATRNQTTQESELV